MNGFFGRLGDDGGFEFDFSCCHRLDFLNELLRHTLGRRIVSSGVSPGHRREFARQRESDAAPLQTSGSPGLSCGLAS